MPAGNLSPIDLDYIQRAGQFHPIFPPAISNIPLLVPLDRQLSQIKAIGRLDKNVSESGVKQLRGSNEDILITLSAAKYPLAFYISGNNGESSIYFGTWATAEDGSLMPGVAERQITLEASLRSQYQAVVIEPAPVLIPVPPACGIVLGEPVTRSPDPLDGSLSMDRLIRTMSGMKWGCLILAVPLPEELMILQRNAVIENMRSAESSAQTSGMPSPLVSVYTEMLKRMLENLTEGISAGAWQTTVYLLGDNSSIKRLAGCWCGIFGGNDPLLQPIQFLNAQSAKELIGRWAIPLVTGEKSNFQGLGPYRHPFLFQTLLTSKQLAAYVHLPHLETNGFSVQMVPTFDSVPTEAGGPAITLGKTIPRNRYLPPSKPKSLTPEEKKGWDQKLYNDLPESFYKVDLKALTKHAFIAGVTGSGKTTTIFHILKSAMASESPVPFLVIEPAKTEYRELRSHPEVGNKLQVFTPGDENVSPFRLNPFEVPEGTSIGKHIDLLRSLFSACFGWWNPLPQLFEKCACLAYQDKGWDVAGDYNRRTEKNKDPRAQPILSEAFPSLSDLLAKADEVIPTLGYDLEAKGRVQGHFRATLLGLRNGAKGRMLDVQRSLPMSLLFENPTVLELESLGDDDDKAFMMGLLLIRLVEHRLSPQDKEAAKGRGLRHLLVFEEAHRLLTNVPLRGEEGAANPRAKAVESFANMLAEIRKYGQGVIVSDQVPTKLAPDVIKNTNLKIVHRIVDEPDRKVLAGSMVMTHQQTLAISTLLPGRAAVFAEGDDSPLLVQIPWTGQSIPPDNEALRRIMAKGMQAHSDIFPAHPGCTDKGDPDAAIPGGAACDAARAIVENPIFQRDFVRLIMCLIDDFGEINRLWPSIEWHIAAAIRPGVDKQIVTQCLIARAVEWLVSRRGAQASWAYAELADLSATMRQVLMTRNDKNKSLRQSLFALHSREFPPYAHCGQICDGLPARCLYRQAVEDVINMGTFTPQWNNSNPLNIGGSENTWTICIKAAESLVEYNPKHADAVRQIGLCYGQMMLVNQNDLIPDSRDKLMEALLDEAKGEKARLEQPSGPQ